MTRSSTIALAAPAAALVLPAAAAAKGPSRATIQGPKLERPLTVAGSGEASGTALGNLTQDAGFFPAVFGRQPDPILASPPPASLGPRYELTYVVPGPGGSSLLHQDLYPHAAVGALSYMRPGQVLWDTMRTRGGWYAGGAALKQDLIRIGLPRTAPGTGSSFPTSLLAEPPRAARRSCSSPWCCCGSARVSASARAPRSRRRRSPSSSAPSRTCRSASR